MNQTTDKKQEPKALVIHSVSKSFYCGSKVFVGSICQKECTTCKGLNNRKQ